MTDYTPISCGIYDELELAAMRRSLLSVEYSDDGGSGVRLDGVRLVALRQRDGAEYAEFEDENGRGTEFRLDRIVAIEEPHSSRRTLISPSCAVDATSSPSRVK